MMQDRRKIYLDNNATTMVAPCVIEAMVAELQSAPLNPSSVHSFGRQARNQLTKARRKVAQVFEVLPQEIIFTSGGTEALNLVLRGFCEQEKGHIITSSAEHAATLQTLEVIKSKGWEVEQLPPTSWGAVKVDQVRSALRPQTKAIVLMAANNETGVKTDIEAIAQLAEERNLAFIVDGVALLGKESITLPRGVSAICFSGHKVHGPKGSGLAIIRQKLKVAPQMTGGGQEHTLRSGTENLAAIMGFAQAISLAVDHQEQITCHMQALRDRLERGLLSLDARFVVNGEADRIVNTTNIAFLGFEGEALLMNLDLQGIAVSHGSACSSGSLEPSRVLLAMGYSKERAAASIRFSLSRYTTQEEVDECIQVIRQLINCRTADVLSCSL